MGDASERRRSLARTAAAKTRWRMAQARRRRARMSGRGRATVLSVCAAIGLLGGLALTRGATPEPERPVSAAPAPAETAANAAPPDALLTRLPVTSRVLELPAVDAGGAPVGRVGEKGVHGRVSEQISWRGTDATGPVRVEYTLDAGLTREVFRVLERGRVALGHVIVLDPHNGRVLAYASTDTERFPPTRAYPAASLVKVITAAAALRADRAVAELPCRYRGTPWRLTRSRIDPPSAGKTVSLRKALATSNNQCFAQLAVHAVGGDTLMQAIGRFGWLAQPAPAHAAGAADLGEDRYDLGRLGCGLAGSQITPLHAAQLAASLLDGELVTPRWVDRVVDARGLELPLPSLPAPRRAMSPALARELREMLVDTTRRGTARRAFRGVLDPIEVAGKTGSLSGNDPAGKYEWFIGVAPAENPRIAVATLIVHGDLWWRNASQLAADVLERAFCDASQGRPRCQPHHADRWLRPAAEITRRAAAPDITPGA